MEEHGEQSTSVQMCGFMLVGTMERSLKARLADSGCKICHDALLLGGSRCTCTNRYEVADGVCTVQHVVVEQCPKTSTNMTSSRGQASELSRQSIHHWMFKYGTLQQSLISNKSSLYDALAMCSLSWARLKVAERRPSGAGFTKQACCQLVGCIM